MGNMSPLRWVSVFDKLPPMYETVIVCYRGLGDEDREGTSCWLVGGGHLLEGGWCVETDSEEDVGPFQVCAWMYYPEPPRIAMMRRTSFVTDKLVWEDLDLNFTELNVRTKNILFELGCETWADVLRLEWGQIAVRRGMGPKSMADLAGQAALLGTPLKGMPVPTPEPNEKESDA